MVYNILWFITSTNNLYGLGFLLIKKLNSYQELSFFDESFKILVSENFF